MNRSWSFALSLLCAAPFAAAQPVSFKGTVTCPAKSPLETVSSPGGPVALQDVSCYWSGVELGGQVLTQDRMLSIGIFNSGTCWKASGYDVGTLANKDQSQGEWHEEGCIGKGSKIMWRIVAGTGVIKGIKGSGTITCGEPQKGVMYVNDKPTAVQNLVVVCDVSGTYTLPKPHNNPEKK
jgi:hypothetical protein